MTKGAEMEMNGYQRIQAVLRGEAPDRVPVMLHAFMLAIAEAGVSWRAYREDPEVAARCHIEFVEKYGLDGALFDVDTALTASAVGALADYPDDNPARVEKPLLAELEDAAALDGIDITDHPRIQHSLEAVRLIKQHFGDQVFVRGNCDQAPFALACALRGANDFMVDLLVEPELVHGLIEQTTRICLQFIRAMAAAGADMVSNGDSQAGPSMISPQMCQEFARPAEKALADAARELGVPYLLHICGDTTTVLDQLPPLGVTAVELDYKTSIGEAARRLGDTVLFGTVDPSGVVALGSADQVRAECAKILDAYAGNPRLVLGAGCAIPPMAPPENIHAFVEASKAAAARR